MLKILVPFTLLFVLFSAVDTTPVITSYTNDAIIGKNFGVKAGDIWVKPVTNDVTLPDNVRNNLYSSLESTNRVSLKPIVWTDTRVSFKLTDQEKANIISYVVERMKNRGIGVALSNITFKYQLARPDGATSEWK